jgi:type VI secretion system secreted protein VgrG
VLSDKQILLQSKGDQTVKSAGKLTFEVDGNVQEKYKQDWTSEITGQATLKATQPFEIDGQNVTIKGQAQISVEGNAQVTIKCGPASIQLGPSGVQISGPMIQLG